MPRSQTPGPKSCQGAVRPPSFSRRALPATRSSRRSASWLNGKKLTLKGRKSWGRAPALIPLLLRDGWLLRTGRESSRAGRWYVLQAITLPGVTLCRCGPREETAGGRTGLPLKHAQMCNPPRPRHQMSSLRKLRETLSSLLLGVCSQIHYLSCLVSTLNSS